MKGPSTDHYQKSHSKEIFDRLFEEGVKWLVFSGNLGFEAWVLEVAFALKKDYDFQMATIFLI